MNKYEKEALKIIYSRLQFVIDRVEEEQNAYIRRRLGESQKKPDWKSASNESFAEVVYARDMFEQAFDLADLNIKKK